MLRDLATEKLLSDADMDQLGRVVANLLEEVIILSERVATLEGNATTETMQERIDAVIARVLTPLA